MLRKSAKSHRYVILYVMPFYITFYKYLLLSILYISYFFIAQGEVHNRLLLDYISSIDSPL